MTPLINRRYTNITGEVNKEFRQCQSTNSFPPGVSPISNSPLDTVLEWVNRVCFHGKSPMQERSSSSGVLLIPEDKVELPCQRAVARGYTDAIERVRHQHVLVEGYTQPQIPIPRHGSVDALYLADVGLECQHQRALHPFSAPTDDHLAGDVSV